MSAGGAKDCCDSFAPLGLHLTIDIFPRPSAVATLCRRSAAQIQAAPQLILSAIARFGFWNTFEIHVMFNSEILLRISKEVGAPVSRVETTIKLLEEGGTVPFIARYRKEATGNLDEVK